MASKPIIAVAHSDTALTAEVSFWSASAELELVVIHGASAIAQTAVDPRVAAIIVELASHGEEILDMLQDACRQSKGRIIAVSPLDAKTLSSIRRLFEAKNLDITVIARSDFDTRMLSDLVQAKKKPGLMDRSALAQALREGWVVAHYQPKVPFQQDSEKYGVEALCRIQHPERGILFPDSFIATAEEQDLILELTDAVTLHAFRSLKSWDAQGTELRLALNISPRLMEDNNWFDLFLHRCQEFNIDPGRITLEVTESSSQGSKMLALEILSRLRLKGFLLSIDDFGTGFSSLETLYKLPFGELKIDKGFVMDLQKNAEARALVESTIMLARKLGLRVCAEGVESEALFHELRELKCDDAQGYHVSRAIRAEQIPAFFKEWRESRRMETAGSQRPAIALVQSLLAEILATSSDDEDETIVLSGAPGPGGEMPELARDVIAKVPALLLSGSLLEALSHVHRAMQASRREADAAQRDNLQKLQTALEKSLAAQGSLELRRGGDPIQLVAGNAITIGRQSPTARADIAIGCRWLSRGEKNLRLLRDRGQWTIEDMGSANGHFIEGRRMAARQPLPLPEGDTLLEIGKPQTGPAPAWLGLHNNGQVVIISFGRSEADETTQTKTNRRWLAFHENFSLGASPDADLVVENCGADFLADICQRDGELWIAPREGERVSINGVSFTQPVPLPASAELSLGPARWSVAATSSDDGAADPSNAAAVA